MSRLLPILLALAACTLRPHDFDPTATDTDPASSTTTTPDPTAPVPTTDSPPTTSSTTASTTGATGESFIPLEDVGGTDECSIWIEDCPEGQKCMPSSADGDLYLDSHKCVPIVPNPDGLGDPCKVFGSGVSGEDTCDKHLMCWSVDPETGTGTCTAMCTGSPDQPTCEQPMALCYIAGDGILTLCFPLCDPLAQDCPDGELCIYSTSDPNNFICTLDASGDDGQTFDVCEYLNACDPGLICTNAALAAECALQAAGCCLPFCDITINPPPCPGNGQQCLPWFEDGQAPPFYKNVGVCGLPQ